MKKANPKSAESADIQSCQYLDRPSFTLREDVFLAERENIFSGLWRSLRLFIEYMRGFYVFRNIGNCITIYGSARFQENHPYYQLAQKMGCILAQTGFTVMTGGGPGIMEAANRGAKEGKGLSVSCNIELTKDHYEAPNRYVDKKITMHYFFVRKVMLTKYSLGFIAMPGGFGTLDEFFEMATLMQTGKIKHFPLVLMGKEYWEPIIDFFNARLLRLGTIVQQDIDRLLITDSPEEALAFILKELKQIKKNDHE